MPSTRWKSSIQASAISIQRRSVPRSICRSAEQRLPATATVKPEHKSWTSSANGNRSMSTTAASCKRPRSTRSRSSDGDLLVSLAFWLVSRRLRQRNSSYLQYLPRNSSLFFAKNKQNISKKLNITNKRVRPTRVETCLRQDQRKTNESKM